MAGLVGPTRSGLFGGRGSTGLYVSGQSLWTPFALGSAMVFFVDTAATDNWSWTGSSPGHEGDKVAQIIELAQSIVVSQGTVANQPVWSAAGLNNRQSLVFGGGLTGLVSSAFSQAGSWSAFVCAMNTGANANFILDGDGGIAPRIAQYCRCSGLGTLHTTCFTSGGNNVLSATISSGQAFLYCSQFSSSVFTAFANGGDAVVGSVPSGTPTSGSHVLGIGCSSAGGQGFTGALSCVCLTNNVLGTNDRQKLEGWAAYRFNAQSILPPGHPYKSAPPTMSAEDIERLFDEGMYFRDAAYRRELGLAPVIRPKLYLPPRRVYVPERLAA